MGICETIVVADKKQAKEIKKYITGKKVKDVISDGGCLYIIFEDKVELEFSAQDSESYGVGTFLSIIDKRGEFDKRIEIYDEDY